MPKKKLHQLTASELDIIAYSLRQKSVLNATTGCLEWTGVLSTQYGYPTVWNAFERTTVYARHAALTVAGHPKPQEPPQDGGYRWESHHSCRTKKCVNPVHLTWVSNREHSDLHAGERASRALARRQAKKKAAASVHFDAVPVHQALPHDNLHVRRPARRATNH
jgi:hypothetical protein